MAQEVTTPELPTGFEIHDNCIVAYLDADSEPVEKDQATFARVLFFDGDAELHLLKPLAEHKDFDFDPAKHPRHPAGDSRGGEFASQALIPGAEDKTQFFRRDGEKAYWVDPKTLAFREIGKPFDALGYYAVEYSKEEMKQLSGNILTHNHPRGIALSSLDLEFAARAKLKEIRAVGTDDGGNKWLYRAYPNLGKKWPPIRSSIVELMQEDLVPKYREIVKAKKMPEWKAQNQLRHEANMVAAKEYGYTYERIPIK